LARQARGRARAGTPAEAAHDAEALLLAVHWSRVDEVLKQAGNLAGKVLITCSLPMNATDTALVVGGSSSGAEELAKKARRSRVVAAFGTIPSCCSAYSLRGARPGGRASSTAATIRTRNGSRRP